MPDQPTARRALSALLALLLLAFLAPAHARGQGPTVPEEAPVEAPAAPEPEPTGFAKFERVVDRAMGHVNGAIAAFFFYPLPVPFTGEETLVRVNLPDGVASDGVRWIAAQGAWVKPSTDVLGLRGASDEVLLKSPGLGRVVELGVVPTEGEVRWVLLQYKSVPFAVLWLVLGAIFFTVRMGFINVRAFGHAIAVVRGRYTDPNQRGAGEVSHFQALAAALSATVGLGNIAGVAIAVSKGGPGATFWMIVAGLLGMSSKFAECTLGQKYREVRPDGHVMGGAMHYLSKGLKEMGLGPLGMVLAVMFTVLCIGGSLAGGNSFQVRQSLDAVSQTIPFLKDNGWVYGALMTLLVGIVIIGGIRRIAKVAEKIVPSMCGIYILACLTILALNFTAIPTAFKAIIMGAFTPDAAYGGLIGVLVIGFTRAAFSNEAGIGSAAIAHSAAQTDHPVREGIVALLEPFIDTVIVCTMTALVIVITGAYANPDFADEIAGNQGAALTSQAMGMEISWFPYVLSVAVALFAFSTMISWSYYGERCWTWAFGERSSIVYKLLFLTFTFLGSVLSATAVLDFGDLMILGMALPNVLGVLLLSGKVRADLKDYWSRHKRGEFKTYS